MYQTTLARNRYSTKIVFTEFGLQKKIILDTGMKFTSDSLKYFCRQLYIEPDTLLSRWQLLAMVDNL